MRQQKTFCSGFGVKCLIFLQYFWHKPWEKELIKKSYWKVLLLVFWNTFNAVDCWKTFRCFVPPWFFFLSSQLLVFLVAVCPKSVKNFPETLPAAKQGHTNKHLLLFLLLVFTDLCNKLHSWWQIYHEKPI